MDKFILFIQAERLSAWHTAAVEELFIQEPEMAAYVADQSAMPNLGLTPFPPTWRIQSLSWMISRTQEEANWWRRSCAQQLQTLQADPGLLFAVGKRKGKPEMC